MSDDQTPDEMDKRTANTPISRRQFGLRTLGAVTAAAGGIALGYRKQQESLPTNHTVMVPPEGSTDEVDRVDIYSDRVVVTYEGSARPTITQMNPYAPNTIHLELEAPLNCIEVHKGKYGAISITDRLPPSMTSPRRIEDPMQADLVIDPNVQAHFGVSTINTQFEISGIAPEQYGPLKEQINQAAKGYDQEASLIRNEMVARHLVDNTYPVELSSNLSLSVGPNKACGVLLHYTNGKKIDTCDEFLEAYHRNREARRSATSQADRVTPGGGDNSRGR